MRSSISKALEKVKELAGPALQPGSADEGAAVGGGSSGSPLAPGASSPGQAAACVQTPQPATTPPVADSRALRLHVAGQDIEGVSIAGQETSLALPRTKSVFDIGRCPQRSVLQQHVFISHGHLDHIGGLPFHVSSRQMMGLPPSKILAHPSYVDGIKKLIEAANELNGTEPWQYEVLGLQPGEEYQLPSGYIARPFSTCHPVTSQGYVLYSVRKKLRAELQGKSQDELRELRQAGVDITEVHQVPEVAFTGDTTAELFEQKGIIYDDVFRAKLLIIELTFVDDNVSVEQAREKGHMHIADLVANAHKLHNEGLLLIHFSARYSRDAVLSSLDSHLPPALRAKCVPLLNGFGYDK